MRLYARLITLLPASLRPSQGEGARLTREFSLASLLGVVLVLVVLVWVYRQTALDGLKQQEERAHIAVTTILGNAMWVPYAPFFQNAVTLPREQLSSRPEIADLQTVAEQQIAGTPIVKVKIYDSNGLTVFSTERAQIGEDNGHSAGITTARRGEIASEISFRRQLYALEGVISDRDIISTYVPMRRTADGPVEGVFEVYSDVTPLVQAIRATERRVLGIVTLILAGLYMFLLLIVRRAERELEAHEAERLQHDERVRYHAYHDVVTGLPNRVRFSEQLDAAMRRGKRSGRSLGILLLDLDGFKLVNDSLGHEAGDELLKRVADRIEFCTRESDMVFRVGGDEFTVVMESLATPETAGLLAQRLLEALAMPVRLGEREVIVGASIGIAVYPGPGTTAESLVKDADVAMYRAKEGGRNRYEFYTPEMGQAALVRLSLHTDLKRALENEEFVLHYQPRASLAQGTVVGVEALLRWARGGHELLAPDKFLSLLEDSGLIIPVGEWVLNEACRQNMAWQKAGLPPMRVSVNVSSRQFRGDAFVSSVLRALRSSGLHPRYLELEITESLLVENTERAIGLLSELKAVGVSLAIDDFGSGYSSLNYLKRFPVDFLKIDRTFIRDLGNNRRDAAIVAAIAALAHNLELGVVAEGVEEPHQLDFLGQQGCHEVQGNLLSRPVAPEYIAKVLSDVGAVFPAQAASRAGVPRYAAS